MCLERFDVVLFRPSVEYAILPYFNDFENGEMGVFLTREWADQTALPATDVTKPSSLVAVAAGRGHDSEFALQMGKACEDGFATNAVDLHLDLENHTDVEMTFWIFLNKEETRSQDGIYLSTNGGIVF